MPRPTPDTLFLGRADELAQMEARLRRAALREPQVIVVAGPAGIGKTSLVRRFLLDMGPGPCVLQASGEESETHLPYAVVAQLLGHLPEGRHPRVPGIACWLPPGELVPDPVVVGSALLDALGRVQDRMPVVVVIDDIQWADSPSLHAITFALRRLRVDGVLIVMMTRDAHDPRLPLALRRVLSDDSTLRMQLAGLAVHDISRLNTALGQAPLPRWAVARLWGHTHGNPLHIRALLSQFPTEVFVASSTVLPAPHVFEQLVTARLNARAGGTRRLVEATAVLGMSGPLHMAAAIGGVSDPLVALDEAMTSELLQEGEPGGVPRVVFPHPLTRAAVYRGLRPARRSQLHQAAARHLKDPAAVLHHRAAAAAGPDAEIADELHRFAERQVEEGAWSRAAAASQAAARLCPDDTTRAEWFLRSVEYLLLAGDVGQAVELEARTKDLPPSAEQHYVLGHLALASGRFDEACRELTECWDSCDTRTPVDTIRDTAEQLASLHLIQCDTRRAVAWSRRGLKMPSGRRSSYLRESLAIGLGLEGRHDEAMRSLAHLAEDGPRSGPEELDGLMARGLLRLWNGELRAARRDLKDAYTSHRYSGLPFVALVAIAFLIEAEYRAGEWDDAITHGTQALSLAEDTDQTSVLAVIHSFLAGPLAGRGAFEAAETHADAASKYARTLGDINDKALACTALAAVHVAKGNYEEVIRVLRPLLDPAIVHRAALDEAGVVPWRAPFVEALVRTEQLDEAEAVLVPYERCAAARDRWLEQAVAARCRGLLESARGHSDLAERAFRAGLDHCDRGEVCWERALSQLAYGTFLRRIGRRGPAVLQLQPAWETFHRLHATPHLDRCTTELAASGHSPARAREGRHPDLTSQEFTVASLAVRGLTNRQIARELVLSVKTIEYHLGNAYTKLGIRSRMGLAARLALRP